MTSALTPPLFRRRAGTRAALALCLALVASGCSSARWGSPGEPSGPPSSGSAAPGEQAEEEPLLVGPGVSARPPRGDLRLLGSLGGPETFDLDGRAAFTDDLVITVAAGYRVQALERSTGEVRWSTRVRDADPEGGSSGEYVCPTPTPPPGATAVVVITGLACGVLTSLELETGEPVGRVAPDYLDSVPVTRGVAQVGEWTYWADPDGRVHRIEPDGSSTVVLDAADLGVDGDIRTTTPRLQQIFADASGDVLVVKTDPESVSLFEEGVRAGTNPTEEGELIGVRLDATAEQTEAQEVWRVETARVVGDVVPRSTTVGGTSEPLGGSVLSAVPTGRDRARARLAPLDPGDGTLGEGYTSPPRPRAGLPTWSAELGGPRAAGRSVVTAGSLVLATTVLDDAEDAVALYDLAAGEMAWVWRPESRLFSVGRRLFEVPTARPVGFSEDGEHVYVAASSQNGALVLVELDAGTGEQTHLWRVPRSVSDRMSTVEMYLDGDRLVVQDPEYLASPGGIRVALLAIG